MYVLLKVCRVRYAKYTLSSRLETTVKTSFSFYLTIVSISTHFTNRYIQYYSAEIDKLLDRNKIFFTINKSLFNYGKYKTKSNKFISMSLISFIRILFQKLSCELKNNINIS